MGNGCCGSNKVAKDFEIKFSNIQKANVKIKATKYSDLLSSIEKFIEIKRTEFTIQNCSSESEFSKLLKNSSMCINLTVKRNSKHSRETSGDVNTNISTPQAKPNFENLKKECDRIKKLLG